jgi:hypothetical protein
MLIRSIRSLLTLGFVCVVTFACFAGAATKSLIPRAKLDASLPVAPGSRQRSSPVAVLGERRPCLKRVKGVLGWLRSDCDLRSGHHGNDRTC